TDVVDGGTNEVCLPREADLVLVLLSNRHLDRHGVVSTLGCNELERLRCLCQISIVVSTINEVAFQSCSGLTLTPPNETRSSSTYTVLGVGIVVDRERDRIHIADSRGRNIVGVHAWPVSIDGSVHGSRTSL